MLKRNQAALQVFRDGRWQYVFCRAMPGNKVATTECRGNALGERDLEFFTNKFGNDQFRIEMKGRKA